MMPGRLMAPTWILNSYQHFFVRHRSACRFCFIAGRQPSGIRMATVRQPCLTRCFGGVVQKWTSWCVIVARHPLGNREHVIRYLFLKCCCDGNSMESAWLSTAYCAPTLWKPLAICSASIKCSTGCLGTIDWF